jgi:L-cysteine S-thiosulfotransferase
MRNKLFNASLALAGTAIFSLSASAESVNVLADKYVEAMFAKATPEWKARATQDETQRVCSQPENQPAKEEAEKIVAREKATVVYPEGGVMGGDWKKGEAIAQNGRGGQFSDDDKTVNGGNCYACHQLAPSEVSYGTLGPTLQGYGKARNFIADEAKTTYAKLYNSQSAVACSMMPRFGYHKFLTEAQLKDVLAYLFDPASPVNK